MMRMTGLYTRAKPVNKVSDYGNGLTATLVSVAWPARSAGVANSQSYEELDATSGELSSLASDTQQRLAVAESKVSLRGLKCPLPALKTRKLLAKLSAGDVLEIECTDPLTTIDIPSLLRETGDQLEESARKGMAFVFRIRKN
jgi:tRNA 2-thiouridine synthesizing protein A